MVKRTLRILFVVGLAVSGCLRAEVHPTNLTNLGHPRLYFGAADLKSLRAARFEGQRSRIWTNLSQSADWCLTRSPRQAWIAPTVPDPRYENLYDRFYAIMGDLAITEHLAFAYALSGNERYGEAAKQWLLGSCRAWQREAEDRPDSGKAYAISRLLKGVAVGYDIIFDRLSDVERKEIRETLARIGSKYFSEWFSTAAISGPGYCTHHAVVEWGSFGVMALALLGEEPAAAAWLDATRRKFEEHLLPLGLAVDGAQTEGATFWASTMHYRLFFMDPLRRVTGTNLFRAFAAQMNADLALASVACRKRPGLDEHHANVVLEPSYGQLDYYAPILLALAREYRRPVYQLLASWDDSLGSLQRTRYITPHGEELLFELGAYAFLWNDDSVPPKAAETKLSWHFPSVDEAYARSSWKPGDLLVGVRHGEVVISAGGQTIFIAPDAVTNSVGQHKILGITDDGRRAVIHCADATASTQIELDRRSGKVQIQRSGKEVWKFWCQGQPERRRNQLRWRNAATLEIREGQLSEWSPQGHTTTLSVANGLLPLHDPVCKSYPLVTVLPTAKGRVILEIR
jgi:hypothetical protein